MGPVAPVAPVAPAGPAGVSAEFVADSLYSLKLFYYCKFGNFLVFL